MCCFQAKISIRQLCITRTVTVYPFKLKVLTLEKFRQIFQKIKRRGPQVQIIPGHKLEVIKLLIIATEPIKTVILNILGLFPNLSRKGSMYNREGHYCTTSENILHKYGLLVFCNLKTNL